MNDYIIFNPQSDCIVLHCSGSQKYNGVVIRRNITCSVSGNIYRVPFAGIKLVESGPACFMCSRIFFSFLRMLSLVTFEYFFFSVGLGQSHSSTFPYCSSICLPVVRLALRRSRSTCCRVGDVFSTDFVLAIKEGGAKYRVFLPALEAFIFAYFGSGQGILPDWHDAHITSTKKAIHSLIHLNI